MQVEELRARVGEELGVSRWFTMDQARIDAFASVTEDQQFLHVDPDRAAQTPFGGTIAHGFLTLSMLSAMAYDAQPGLRGVTMSVNYGFDRIRFLSPVRAGARIRARFTLAEVHALKPGEITLHWDSEVQIEGQDKPALLARWINRRYLGEPDAA